MNIKKTMSSLLALIVIVPIVLCYGTGVQAAGTSRDFVQRIYKYVLERDSDKEGEDFWVNELSGGKMNGGQLAKQFLDSKEFKDKNKNDTEFVTILYKTFFGRDPEKDGLDFWVGNLTNKKSTRETTVDEFINSQEWADICAEYNIVSGGNKKPTVKDTKKDPSQKTKDFTERLYTSALERSSDKSGLEYWSKKLANQEITGEEAAAEFFFSKEMKDAKLSDAEFIYRLYATFLGRVPDLGGFDFWLSEMSKAPADKKYEKAFYGFSRSQEFVQLCNEAGIVPYIDKTT